MAVVGSAAKPAGRAAGLRLRRGLGHVRDGLRVVILALILVVGEAARAAGAMPPCRGDLSVTILDRDPAVPTSARAREEKDGVGAYWLSTRRVVVLPIAPGLRINGAAGLELQVSKFCAVDLAPGYHRGLDVSSRQPVAALTVAVCGEGEDEACLWIDLRRPF